MTNTSMCLLVLYYSKHGVTKSLADSIVKGIESEGIEAMLRTVPDVHPHIEQQAAVPQSGAPYVTLNELAQCDGLAFGCPTHFGNMPSAMKYFLDTTSSLWLKGSLINKPACVFTSSSSLHGGQETTLLTMMLPLIHHGMIILGVPYSEPGLHKTTSGGTPYGASALGNQNKTSLTEDEKSVAISQGKRLALIAKNLNRNTGSANE
ncbi:MAG: NAD(P)H dehydrogenase (quinone) [Glaciecola sp.]|jgi:NAD(P)H dehydrogenase (quinone)